MNNQRTTTKIQVAILTGDIVRSAGLTEKRRVLLYEAFKTLSELLIEKYSREVVPFDLKNFRGDGWQLLVDRPEFSLDIALFIRSYIRFTFALEKLDSRLAIGIGSIDLAPSENISAGDGAAFMLSGHLLDTLSASRMGIVFEDSNLALVQNGLLNNLQLLDIFVKKWSPAQSQAIFWALQKLNQKEIAGKWIPKPITQAAISKNLKAAHWEQVKSSLQYFSATVLTILSDNS